MNFIYWFLGFFFCCFKIYVVVKRWCVCKIDKMNIELVFIKKIGFNLDKMICLCYGKKNVLGMCRLEFLLEVVMECIG